MPTDLRRDHVLTVATLAFMADGYGGVSMQQIAERAGVTKPVVYALFHSKEDLFAAVVDFASVSLAERIGGATSDRGESQLGAGIRAFLEYSEETQGLWGQIFASIQHAAVADAVQRLQQQQVDLVAASLRRGHEDAGLEPDDREIEALAHLISGAVQAVAGWWSRNPDIALDDVVAFVEASLAPTLSTLRGELSGTTWFR